MLLPAQPPALQDMLEHPVHWMPVLLTVYDLK